MNYTIEQHSEEIYFYNCDSEDIPYCLLDLCHQYDSFLHFEKFPLNYVSYYLCITINSKEIAEKFQEELVMEKLSKTQKNIGLDF